MAKIKCMLTFLILFTSQILCGEGRNTRYLNGIQINHIKGPSHRGIRKLGTLTDEKPDNPNKPSSKFSETIIIHKENLPSLKPNHKTQLNKHKVDSFWVGIKQTNCIGENCPEDFKPTAPGKSPGAGHSFVTSINKVSTKKQTKGPKKMWNNLEKTTNDFRETKPGQSPGAGHPKEEKIDPTPTSFFSESEMISTNDFKPTDPGSSPGAGHPETKENNVNYCLSVKCEDDFRPTNPGDSPGAGHPQGGLDDYRPTKPGQSPGAGHAIVDKQEP